MHMTYPYLTYDEDADVLYVSLADGDVAETRSLGDLRLIDVTEDGMVHGVEFVSASHGVDLDGVPFARLVASVIGDSGLPLKTYD